MRRLLAVALALPLLGCGSDQEDATLTVLAAASLTETFTDLATRFETDHPGVEVDLVFESSATLAQQALEGAPGDVLATADTDTMADAADTLDEAPQAFATNTMVLVTPADNPAGIESLADLADVDAAYVACVDSAPCGKVARALLDANGVTRAPASLEVDVKAVLARVTGNEADAGLVYATDAVAAADQVDQIEIPQADEQVTAYSLATLRQARAPALAQEFVDLVLSPEGQQVLGAAGFGQP